MEKSYYPWSQDESKLNQLPASASLSVTDLPTTAQGGQLVTDGSVSNSRAIRASTLEVVLDVGALVGLNRNLEFTAGQRDHRISNGPYTRS